MWCRAGGRTLRRWRRSCGRSRARWSSRPDRRARLRSGGGCPPASQRGRSGNRHRVTGSSCTHIACDLVRASNPHTVPDTVRRSRYTELPVPYSRPGSSFLSVNRVALFRTLLVLGGVAAIAFLVAQIGPTEIWHAFRGLSWRLLLVLI